MTSAVLLQPFCCWLVYMAERRDLGASSRSESEVRVADSLNYLDEIKLQASKFRENERNLPLYFPDLATAPPTDSLNQVFGSPVGITDGDWPCFARMDTLLREADLLPLWDACDLRMEHVFTIDLRDVKLLGAPSKARAMLLFVSNASHHHADQNGNGHTAVVFLTQSELARGHYGGAVPQRSRTRWSRRFALVRIDVPGDIFDPGHEEHSDLALLHDAVWQAPARLGGCPIWVRDPCDPRDYTRSARRVPAHSVGVRGTNTFVMQFERRFADINLGRDGVMYVSGTGAYYQGYE